MKLTLEQQKEKVRFGYSKNYRKWLDKALRLNYGTVDEAIKALYWGPEPGSVPLRTLDGVALHFGVSAMTISNIMKKLGIPARPPAHRDPGFHFTRQGGR